MYTFKVGDPVMVKKAIVFGGLSTLGICGCVDKTDEQAGICVALCVSRIYRPRFWYLEEHLAAVNESKGWRDKLSAADIQEAIGGRGDNLIMRTPLIIMLGFLRSWMLARVAPPVGHPLEISITRLKVEELLATYNDISEGLFIKWVSDNDTRVRRPRITGDATVAGGIIGIPRTKITGRR